MRIDIMTLFPDTVHAVLHESILGRAAKKGAVEINCIQIRDYTENRQRQVDDYPYGGGRGCVMMAQPLKSCLEHVLADGGDTRTRVIYLSPQGRTFTQETARRLQRDYDRLVLVCGHYEGIDERFIEACVDEEISLGDFVLTGGEIAAMAVADAVCRLVPGVLADEECFTGESHWDGLLEYPQYTRPENWEGREVPEILLQGDHARIEKWRRKKQLERTRDKRPDMFEAFLPQTEQDKLLLREMERDKERVPLTKPVTCRKAVPEDLEALVRIVQEARESLKKLGADQWQGPYPSEADLERDIAREECYAVLHGEELASFFVLSEEEEACYADIRDGKWSDGEPYCTLHRAAVSAKYRGTGIAEKMMRFAEEQTLLSGRRRLRTDTHRKNKPMQRLLRNSGFLFRGNVFVKSEPGHDEARQAYEKRLKKQGEKR